MTDTTAAVGTALDSEAAVDADSVDIVGAAQDEEAEVWLESLVYWSGEPDLLTVGTTHTVKWAHLHCTRQQEILRQHMQ